MLNNQINKITAMLKKELRQKVENFVDSFCENNHSTMICIYTSNGNDAITGYGDPFDLVGAFTKMFKCACVDNTHMGIKEVVSTILCALSEIVENDEKCSDCYKEILQNIIDGNYGEECGDTLEELTEKIEKMGYTVVRKHNKKNKKHIKHINVE